MADGFVALTQKSFETHSGVEELNRMLQLLFELAPGDGETVRIYKGYGTPLNVVAASPGSIYMNLSGGALTGIYIKESGTDGSGWVAK